MIGHIRRFIVIFTGTILLVWLTSLPALAQSAAPAATNTPIPATTFGVIKGRVVNEAGEPLPNAVVVIAGFASMRGEQSVVADREGKFEITGLEPKSYRLSTRLPAYVPLLRDEEPPEKTRYEVGETVTLVLAKGGVITGTVTNPLGEPVVGVRVRARMLREAERMPLVFRFSAFEQRTDDRGVYRIYGLPEGTYVVWAGGAGQQSGEADGYDTDIPTYAPGSTRDTAQEIAVRLGVENTNVDIRYRDEPGRVISGRIVLPESAENIRSNVILTMANDGGSPWFINSTQLYNKGFIFRGLADGEYDLRSVTAQPNGVNLSTPPKRIKVNGADVTGIELLPQPVSSISGKVVLQELKVPECSNKKRPVLSETFVSVTGKTEALNQQWRPYWPLGLQTIADSEGNLKLPNLLPGQYSFASENFAQQWYLESITLPATTPNTKTARPVDATRSWTTLRPGEQLSGLTITLAQGAASLYGAVAVPEGEKLADNLSVYLVPAEREKADETLRFFSASVRGDAKVALNNIAPGRYWILTKADGPALSKLRLPDQVELRSKLRREAEAAKSEIEFKPCQNVADFRF